VLFGEARSELIVANSRFFACANHAASVEDARDYIATISSAYSDATHHVPAFLISGDTLEFETTLRDFWRGRIQPRVVEVKPDSLILISPKAGWMPVSQESDSDKTK
jgi:hypothetical protein